MTTNKQIEIYQGADGQTEIEMRLEADTLWLSQGQMAELVELATTEDFSVVRQEGQRQVRRNLKHYNLDAIISVGYRVSSAQATRFRQWATPRLKEHLVHGYSLSCSRFEKNAAELEQALLLVQKAAQSPGLSGNSGRGLVDAVSRYTQTFLWLQRYGKGLLEKAARLLYFVVKNHSFSDGNKRSGAF